MRVLLATLLEEFETTLATSEKSLLRPYTFSKAPNLIKVAIGMRRSGKSTFLFQCIRDLLAEGVPLKHILYLNFEDERILPMDQKAMGELIDAFYTLYPENYNEQCYLFLDEVQVVEGWPQVVRRLHDTKKAQIFLTGSSAKLLSREIATSLRGRSISIEIWPYSFAEYIKAQGLPTPSQPFGKKSYDIFQAHLLNYFNRGGFPGVQDLNELDRRNLLQNYVDVVVLRDVIERHKVENIKLIKYLMNALLKNFSTCFSVNKFFNDIKSQGYKVGKATLYNYIDYLEDAYLIFGVPLFTESVRKAQTKPHKTYAIDTGLINANILSVSQKQGALLENVVYLDLRRRGDKIYYYQTAEGYEVDFLTQKKSGEMELLQVTWSPEDKQTLAREERALLAAEKELGIKGRLIDLSEYFLYLQG